ncbi:MAG: type II toxin-antitoxin system Phd/YefM family antitoxin [Desulfobacteraceae bacterium]|nr:MAG: type II toxin-antitoxin system Phd/YefM family antitoxin [Desulfobacteraceae bacterium]
MTSMVNMINIGGNMLKTISAMQARQSLGRVMNEVALKGDDYIIERDGKPIVAVVSLDKFSVLQKERGEAQQLLTDIRQKMAGADSGELEALIKEAAGR